MKNFRLAAIALLSLAVIALGAFLPRIVGAWQDGREAAVLYAPIPEVSLEFDHVDQENGIRNKLILLQQEHDSLSIPDSMASMSVSAVEKRVLEVVRDYQAAGLIPALRQELNKKRISSSAYLVRRLAGGDQGTVFWSVDVDLDDSYTQHLNLILDDETGTVCTIHYTNEALLWGENTSQEQPDPELLKKWLQSLCSVYLTGLGAEFQDEDPADLARGAVLSGAVLSTDLNWSDILYGEISISFVVTSSYFHVTGGWT